MQELHLEGRQVNDSWRMVVDSHGYGGLGGIEVVIGCMSGDAGAHPEYEVKTLMTSPSRCAALG